MLTTLALVLAMAAALVLPVTSAWAQEPAADPVRVELAAMSPRIAVPGDTISLSGTVTNTSGSTLQAVQVYFWRDQQLRTTREELATTSPAVGARYLPTFSTLGDEGSLRPGESDDFTVTMPTAQLGVAARDGVTLVGVQVRGSQGSGNTTLARAAAWLPQDAGTTLVPVRVASVVLLSARTTRLEQDLFLDDQLAGEVADGGRLDLLLEEAARPGRSWLVDPALLVALRDMADDSGYALADGTAGTGAAAARAWLAAYAELPAEGHRLPYASADVELLAAIDRPEVLRDAVSVPVVPDDVAALPLVVRPAEGVLSDDGLAVVESVDSPATVLAANASGSTTTGELTVVAYDPTALVPDQGMVSAVQQRQHTAATALLDAVQGRRSQVRLVADAAAAGVDAADPTARTALSALPTEVGLQPTLAAHDREPSATRADAVAEAADDRTGLAELFVDPQAAADATGRIVALLAGAGVDDPEGAGSGWYAALADWERDRADRILRGDALALTAQPVLLTAREDTPFPVTVTNNLAQAVALRVVFDSENSDRLHVPPVDVPRVGPGESIGVTVVPEVTANGRFTVVAQLTTPSGRPVGLPVDIEVQATQAGRVGWILMAISGIVVVGTTVLRVKQVRAERSQA